MPGRLTRSIGIVALGAASLAFVAATHVAGAAVIRDTHDRHHHHNHRHHEDDCGPVVTTMPHLNANTARHGDDDHQCGPPPTVPEVPWTYLLPLSGAAVVGGVLLTRRHRPIPAELPTDDA